MTGTAQIEQVHESDLSASIGALESAARSLRDQAGRVTAALDGVASALDRERNVAELPAEQPTAAATPDEAGALPAAGQTARTNPFTARALTRDDEPTGQAALWVPGLVCALALIVSLALVGIELALAIAVLIVAAVMLPMRWWMPALAAVALGLALAIQSSGGPRTDDVAVMLVAFILVSGALLLYEVWQRLHSTLQA